MRPETRSELAHRLFHYLDTGTTAMAEEMFTNPVSAYTSQERLALERTILFGEYPLLVGLSCQLPGPGAYVTDDDAGTPILVVRGIDGRPRAFANVCRHPPPRPPPPPPPPQLPPPPPPPPSTS